MRLKRNRDVYVNRTGHLSGILYTTRRMPVSTKEFHSPHKEKKANVFKQRVQQWLERRLTRRDQQTVALPVTHSVNKPVVQQVGSARPRWGRFYSVVTVTAVSLVVMAVVVSGGVFLPGVRSVTVNDAGRIIHADTTEQTVGAFFEKNGIALDDSDVLEVSLATPIEDGMEIIIRRAMPLTIYLEDAQTEVKMLAGTVEDALLRAGVELDEEDEVYPSQNSYVTPGMTINVIDVEVEYVTEEEVLEYKEITKNSDKLEKGKRVLMQQGENGLQKNQYQVTYKNGEEVSRELVETTVVKEPVDKITHVGTYVKPTVTPTKKPGNTGNKDTGKDLPKDEDGLLTKVPSTNQIHSGTLYEHKSVPAPAPSIIAKTITINRCTAYTHTGNRTATGTWPRIGTLAADPKQIPYGTKLYIPGYGYGRVEDTGSNKHDADTYCLDLFMETRKECLNWGVKRNIKVYLLK